VKPGKVAAGARYCRNRGQLTIAKHWENELAKAGRGKRCDSLLTDPRRLADSIGPDCREKT
jgi:hypothetical protein